MKIFKPLSSVLLAVCLSLSFSLVCFADMPVFGETPISEITLEEIVTPSEDISQSDTPSTDTPTEELPPLTGEQPPATETEQPNEYIPIDYNPALNDIHERLQSIDQSAQILIYGVIPIFSAVLIIYKLLGAFKDYFCP